MRINWFDELYMQMICDTSLQRIHRVRRRWEQQQQQQPQNYDICKLLARYCFVAMAPHRIALIKVHANTHTPLIYKLLVDVFLMCVFHFASHSSFFLVGLCIDCTICRSTKKLVKNVIYNPVVCSLFCRQNIFSVKNQLNCFFLYLNKDADHCRREKIIQPS